METNSAAAAESFWIFALAAKSEASSSFQTLFSLAFLLLFWWLTAALLYWAYPGGPAWGRHFWLRTRKSSSNIGNSNSSSAIIVGPRGLPVLGSIHLMTGLAHRKLAAEARRCRATRLMALSLGHTRVIIASHPDVAKDILNSSAFMDRPVKESPYSLMFHRAIGFAPYGVYWRTLRRIAAAHLFCPKQIAASEPQRFELATQMAAALRGNEPIRIRDLLKRASLNNMMCSVFGRRYELCSPNEETEELRCLVEEGYELLGKLNWSDHLPFLAGFDPQKIRSRCSRLVPRVNRFVNRIIHEHRTQSGRGDIVDVLLSLQGSDKLSDSDMVAVLWEMIFRGTDTVAVLIEWVLARLVLHPDIQRKVHGELDAVVGKSRPVTESDIPALAYLQAVIKETLRLHPPGPLLSWSRLAITDAVVDGCHVPEGTTAMVNMWAISRDPEVWAQPERFLPERFVDSDFSVLGSDLRLAPFGSGRRSCPGKALGLATVSFWVATLLHEFEWIDSERNPVSLSELMRLSCEMAVPLGAKVHPRR